MYNHSPMEEQRLRFAKRQLCCQGQCGIEKVHIQDNGQMMIHPTCRKTLADMWGYVTDEDCKRAGCIHPIIHARL